MDNTSFVDKKSKITELIPISRHVILFCKFPLSPVQQYRRYSAYLSLYKRSSLQKNWIMFYDFFSLHSAFLSHILCFFPLDTNRPDIHTGCSRIHFFNSFFHSLALSYFIPPLLTPPSPNISSFFHNFLPLSGNWTPRFIFIPHSYLLFFLSYFSSLPPLSPLFICLIVVFLPLLITL